MTWPPFQQSATRRAEVRQLLRFVVVGVANTAVTLAVIYVARQRGVAVWPASTAGYLVGMVQGFLLNRAWTFGGRAHALPVGAQAAVFVAANLLCSTLFGWLNAWLSTALPLLASSLLATALIVPLSYGLNRWGAFRPATRGAGGESAKLP